MDSDQIRPIRVLVADDEADVRESYRDILEGQARPIAGSRLADLRAQLFCRERPREAEDVFELTLCVGAEEALPVLEGPEEEEFSMLRSLLSKAGLGETAKLLERVAGQAEIVAEAAVLGVLYVEN